jgi:hypothetical protein
MAEKAAASIGFDAPIRIGVLNSAKAFISQTLPAAAVALPPARGVA